MDTTESRKKRPMANRMTERRFPTLVLQDPSSLERYCIEEK